MIRCEFCGEVLPEGATVERRFCGPLCQISYREREKGRAGLWRDFVRGNRYHCPVEGCEAAFRKQAGLRDHVREVHGLVYNNFTNALYHPERLKLCAVEGCSRVAHKGDLCAICRKERRLRERMSPRPVVEAEVDADPFDDEPDDDPGDPLAGARMVVVTPESGPSVHGVSDGEAIRLLRVALVALTAREGRVAHRVRMV